MRPRLQILIPKDTSIPHAEVPCNSLWELVEYLSFQRVFVIYKYHETFFDVSFPRTSPSIAQKILDDWLQAPLELQELNAVACLER